MLPQVAQRDGAVQAVQGVVRVGHQQEAHAHQVLALVARGHGAVDGDVDAAFFQQRAAVAEHGLHHLDARVLGALAEALQAIEQAPVGVDHLHRQPQLGFPAQRQAGRGRFQRGGLGHQVARALVELLTGGREPGLAALQLEYLHAQLRLDLLHRVGDGGLAAAELLGRARVAAGLHHGHQGVPLIERDAGVGHGFYYRLSRWF